MNHNIIQLSVSVDNFIYQYTNQHAIHNFTVNLDLMNRCHLYFNEPILDKFIWLFRFLLFVTEYHNRPISYAYFNDWNKKIEYLMDFIQRHLT